MLPPGATLILTAPRALSAPVEADLLLGVPLVDELLKLRMKGCLDEVTAIIPKLTKSEIDAYVKDTAGAAIAAVYALLRAGDRSLALDAVRELHNCIPGAADVKVMRAETDALRGKHERALRRFISARRAGLPAFAYGVNYLVDRLRFYVQAEHKPDRLAGLGIKPDDIEAAKEALRWVQNFALFSDFSYPVTCYTGLDPSDPDDELLTEKALAALAETREITLPRPRELPLEQSPAAIAPGASSG